MVSGDSYSYLKDDCRAIGNVGLFIWVSVEGTAIIDLRLHDLGSLTLREGEQRIKMLRRMFVKGKAYPLGNFTRDSDVHTELTKALVALRIHRTLVYRGIDTMETFKPVDIVVGVFRTTSLSAWSR